MKTSMMRGIMEVDVTERMSINPCILLIKACVVILSFRQAASHHVLIVVVTRVVNYVTVRNKVKTGRTGTYFTYTHIRVNNCF